MRELQEKQKIKRRIYSAPAIIALFLFMLVLAKGTFSAIDTWRESATKVADLRQKEAKLLAREAELTKNIEHLATPEGIAEELKEKFNVSTEGEYVAVIVDARNLPTTTEPQKESFWQRLKNAIIRQ